MRNRLITPLGEILDALLKTPFRPESFMLNGKEIPYMQLKIPIEVEDPFCWLDAQTLYPKIYWETPKDGVIAGIGAALTCDHIPCLDGAEAPKFFGGRDFTERQRTTWGTFPSNIYFLPLAYIEKTARGTFLIINRIQNEIQLDIEEEVSLSSTKQKLLRRIDSPSYVEWEHEVSGVLEGIVKDEFQKVVLARSSRFEYSAELSPYAILRELKGKNRFAFQFSKDQAFIGTSPETLYRREGLMIESAAVAGTRPRGKTEEEDELLADELINSPKEQYEFQIVEKMIKKNLMQFCSKLEQTKQQVLKTPSVQHLYHLFRGTLSSGISDREIIEALHPTPAVGGDPRQPALEEILSREKFDRGWYAAPIGWIDGKGSHHLVGIRSALVEENVISLFAGTGLVYGSIPSKEWQELEHKISQFTGIL